jgi:hypothetical protein
MAFVLDVTKTAGTEGVNATTLTFSEDWFSADDGLLAGDYIMVVCSNQTGTNTALELTSATGSWTQPDSTDSPRIGSFYAFPNLVPQVRRHHTCRPSRQHLMAQHLGMGGGGVGCAWCARCRRPIMD